VPVLSWLLIAGRNALTGANPRARLARTFRGCTPTPVRAEANSTPAETSERSFAQPMYRATIRFPSKPGRPNPQSQSFSRSYGSGLPTSLTYIHLSARGCSPWRPDADMGTNWHEGISFLPLDFQVPHQRSWTPQEPRRYSGQRPSL
jgi:hypothetical protein